MKFTNPRTHAEFTDWPLGGTRRGRCVFGIEYKPKKGWRITRTTTGKPKLGTYGGQIAIVDGDDGKTYLIQRAGQFDFISIHGSDMKCAEPKDIGGESSVFPRDGRYKELLMLIEQANKPAE